MKITVIGTGYVGLVTGACLADLGNDVLCLDVDEAKIAKLQDGIVPIHEPGLTELVRANVEGGRLRFTTDEVASVRHGMVQFIAVGTPPDDDGSADVHHVLDAASNIGRHMDEWRLVIVKSTVPVGTSTTVRDRIARELHGRGASTPFAVASNPEFLKEGAAVADFMRPDRIVVGTDDAPALETIRALYAPFERNHDKLVVMDVRSAELTKYAANAMLATRISFMNEMATLAEAVGADIDAVRRGIGGDPRIGTHFLYAGCGYGGSCLPKDVLALGRTAQRHRVSTQILDAVHAVNERQKQVLLERIERRFGASLSGRVIAVWGLAFKPGTDDMREAPSRTVVPGLLRRDATVRLYDPIAAEAAARAFGAHRRLLFVQHAMDALRGADALVLLTEWKEFRSLDYPAMATAMRQRVIFDGRNIVDPAAARMAGFEYLGIGRA